AGHVLTETEASSRHIAEEASRARPEYPQHETDPQALGPRGDLTGDTGMGSDRHEPPQPGRAVTEGQSMTAYAVADRQLGRIREPLAGPLRDTRDVDAHPVTHPDAAVLSRLPRGSGPAVVVGDDGEPFAGQEVGEPAVEAR